MAHPTSRRPKEEELGKYRSVSFTSVLAKGYGANPLVSCVQAHKGEDSDWEKTSWIYQVQILLDQNLVAFCDAMIGFEDKGRGVDVIYLHFGKLLT